MKSVINKYLKDTISQENIEETTIVEEPVYVEDTDPETWIQHPETELDSLREATDVAEQLDELADASEGAPAAALEAYQHAFKAVVGKDYGPSRTISAEEVKGRKAPGAHLATAIRTHAKNIRRAVALSLEEYSEKAKETFSGLVKTYEGARAQLDKVEDELHVDENRVVKINHANVWKLFHKDGKFIKPEALAGDVQDVNKLVSALHQAANGLGSGNGDLSDMKFSLMMNTNVTVADGRVTFKSEVPPQPKKEWSDEDKKWITRWTILLGPLGFIGAHIFKDKTGSEADRTRGLKEMHTFITTIKKFDSTIKELQSIVATASKNNSDKEKAGNIIEAAMGLTKHITDMTYGAAVMFTKIANA